MTTNLNISLPTKLKTDAQQTIKLGLYSSLSDFARDAFRKQLLSLKDDILEAQAWKDHEEGKLNTLKTEKDVDNFINSLL